MLTPRKESGTREGEVMRMEEQIREQVAKLRELLHAEGVSDGQRYAAIQSLMVCVYCGDKQGSRCQCWNDE